MYFLTSSTTVNGTGCFALLAIPDLAISIPHLSGLAVSLFIDMMGVICRILMDISKAYDCISHKLS